ncbi:MAG: PGF-CTERM sorting domain-containing protein [Candidatus Methanoperedens sp.]
MKFKKPYLFVIPLLLAIIFVPLALADNSCLNCHEKLSAFNETEQQFNEIRLQHLARDIPCSLQCHTTTLNNFAQSNYLQWTKSKHALFNVTCNNCHGGNPDSDIKETAHIGILLASDPNSTIFYRNVPETCGKCHTKELEQFKNSLHYQKLKALQQAPSCDTCHKPHEFKVLNISEFHSLCSQCHNIDMRIAPSDAPDRAITALANADKLTNEIKLAYDDIQQAKQKGTDVSAAQNDLNNAISIRDGLPVLWHAFDLTSFGNVTDSGIAAAQKAQQESGAPPVSKPTPGFGMLVSVTGIIAIYLLLRRK